MVSNTTPETDREDVTQERSPDFRDQCGVVDLEELLCESETIRKESSATVIPVSCRIRSDFYPVSSSGKAMNEYQKMVEHDLTRPAAHLHAHGGIVNDILTSGERESLFRLSKDPDIISRNSDKRGADCSAGCISLQR